MDVIMTIVVSVIFTTVMILHMMYLSLCHRHVFAHDVFSGNNYQMPVLYWDGEELAQSMAIARFVARKVKLFPF